MYFDSLNLPTAVAKKWRLVKLMHQRQENSRFNVYIWFNTDPKVGPPSAEIASWIEKARAPMTDYLLLPEIITTPRKKRSTASVELKKSTLGAKETAGSGAKSVDKLGKSVEKNKKIDVTPRTKLTVTPPSKKKKVTPPKKTPKSVSLPTKTTPKQSPKVLRIKPKSRTQSKKTPLPKPTTATKDEGWAGVKDECEELPPTPPRPKQPNVKLPLSPLNQEHEHRKPLDMEGKLPRGEKQKEGRDRESPEQSPKPLDEVGKEQKQRSKRYRDPLAETHMLMKLLLQTTREAKKSPKDEHNVPFAEERLQKIVQEAVKETVKRANKSTFQKETREQLKKLSDDKFVQENNILWVKMEKSKELHERQIASLIAEHQSKAVTREIIEKARTDAKNKYRLKMSAFQKTQSGQSGSSRYSSASPSRRRAERRHSDRREERGARRGHEDRRSRSRTQSSSPSRGSSHDSRVERSRSRSVSSHRSKRSRVERSRRSRSEEGKYRSGVKRSRSRSRRHKDRSRLNTPRSRSKDRRPAESIQRAPDPRTWSADAVAKFLSEKNFSMAIQTRFHKNNISGADLVNLSKNDLKNYGLTDFNIVHFRNCVQQLFAMGR